MARTKQTEPVHKVKSVSLNATKNNSLSKKKKNMLKLVIDKNQRENLITDSVKGVTNLTDATHTSLITAIEGRSKLMAEPHAAVLTYDMVEAISKDYNADKQNSVRTDTISNVGISYSVTNRKYIQNINHAYSHELERIPKATQQAQSGRCWLFAALNSIRTHMITAYNLPDHFEISETYLFFWDKIERSYCFLSTLARIRDSDMSEPVYQHVLTNNSPSEDGGNWEQVVNLIQKYGLVPKSIYGESANSLDSTEMNELLHSRLIVFNKWIRDNASMSDSEINDIIVRQMMPDIYQLVCNCLGEPPKVNDTFKWEYNEAGSNFESIRQKGPYRCIENLTPLSFHESIIAPNYNISNKVFISDDPRKPYGKTYCVEYGNCMVGGMPNVTLNTGMKELRSAIAKSVMDKQPVWFACDVGKDFEPYASVLSTSAFTVEKYFNQQIKIDKGASLDALTSFPSHAMSFVGLNTVDEDVDNVDKWKVENSWGSWTVMDPGYLQMDDEWFKRYVYTAVVDIEYLSPELQEAYRKSKYNPDILPYNDPFGSVARKM
uniref:Aminopeptidase n=1 Tax=viral metagenome TaxID=1070528 RepID=A0A6C0J7K9_9ZZZZ